VSNNINMVNLLESALRAETLKQKAIANNIANLQTPGYRRYDVKFDQALAKALNSSDPVNLKNIEPVLVQLKNTPVKLNGNDVNLEQEVGQMIKNSLRHSALVRILRKKYTQMQLAIMTKQ